MREGGDYKKKKYKNEEDEGGNKRRKGEQKGDKSSKWEALSKDVLQRLEVNFVSESENFLWWALKFKEDVCFAFQIKLTNKFSQLKIYQYLQKQQNEKQRQNRKQKQK